MLNHSNIEYAVNEDGSRGYAWNWLTGCSNGFDVCLTRDKCWAKNIASRFHRDFTPTFHEDKWFAKFPREPSRILVCFMGDISYAEYNYRFLLPGRFREYPLHTFILLTKRPEEAYGDIQNWPRNAWLGESLTGAETPERQQQVMAELRAVKGEHKIWVSYEPMLAKLQVSLEGISWLVIGGQSGKGAIKPDVSWLKMLATFSGKRWFKNNLPDKWFNLPRPQESPDD